MSDPWSAQVALPVAVEQLLQNICTTQKKEPPGADVLQKLASLGEEAALGILREISGTVIRKSLGGFILYMIDKASPQRLDPWSAQVALPDAVEQLLQNICTTQKQAPPGADVRQKLASLGEEAALGILREISGTVIRKSLGGFILYMIDKASPQRLDPWSAQVALPDAVEQLLQNICTTQKQAPPGADVRQKLASLGEEAALGILRVISASVIRKSLCGFILYMIDKASYPQGQRLAPVVSPLRTPSSPSRLMFSPPQGT
jgi:uncharacterized membrane protein YsdA (DUF1294 family)